MKKMKKFTFGLFAATALALATIGLAAPASATPFAADCSVHVVYQGNPVDVNWC
jgi:hypothetical protein